MVATAVRILNQWQRTWQNDVAEYADAVKNVFGLQAAQDTAVSGDPNDSANTNGNGQIHGESSQPPPTVSGPRLSGEEAEHNIRGSSVHKEMMKSFRTRKGIKTILGRDADDFKNAQEMMNNVKWQKVAKGIDDAARVLFPAAFFIFLAVTFSSLDR